MNTPDPYDRRTERSLTDTPRQSQQPEPSESGHSAEPSALAVQRDPSQPAPSTVAEAEQNQSKRSIAWVRPSDLPTVVGAPWVRRGIDLEAELSRRARRAPAVTARSGRRIARSAIARPATTTTHSTSREGLDL